MIRLHAVLTGIEDLRLRAAVIGVIEVSFLIQHLAVGDLHRVAGLRVHGEAHIARHLLAEVHHRFSLRGGENALRRHVFLFPRLLALLGDQVLRPFIQADHRLRFFCFKGSVEGLPVIDLAETDLALLRRPALVRGDHLPGTVLSGQDKLGDQAGRNMRPFVPLPFIGPAGHGASVPPLSHGHLQPVLFRQKRRHIIGLILMSLLIRGPAGSQHVFPHSFPVQESLVNAHGGDEKLRLCDLPLRRKRLFIHRAHVSHFLRRRDPFCTPLHDKNHLSAAFGGSLFYFFTVRAAPGHILPAARAGLSFLSTG